MSNTQTAMYYNGNWYGRSGNTDALDARITQTANNIAPRQISDTASKLIAVGEYFTDKLGRLCVCDVQIASGGSIVVGSNCHVVSDGLGNELNGKFGTEIAHDTVSTTAGYTINLPTLTYPYLLVHLQWINKGTAWSGILKNNSGWQTLIEGEGDLQSKGQIIWDNSDHQIRVFGSTDAISVTVWN